MFNRTCTSYFLVFVPHRELWKDFFLNERLSKLEITMLSGFLCFEDFFLSSEGLFDSSLLLNSSVFFSSIICLDLSLLLFVSRSLELDLGGSKL